MTCEQRLYCDLVMPREASISGWGTGGSAHQVLGGRGEGPDPTTGQPGRKSTRPSSSRTRAIPSTAASGSGAKMSAKLERTQSKSWSDAGRAAASPSVQVSVSPWRSAVARATSSSRGDGSMAVTCAPEAAASRAAFPVPHPRSSTRSSGWSDALSTSNRAAGRSISAVRSYEPMPQSSVFGPGGFFMCAALPRRVDGGATYLV